MFLGGLLSQALGRPALENSERCFLDEALIGGDHAGDRIMQRAGIAHSAPGVAERAVGISGGLFKQRNDIEKADILSWLAKSIAAARSRLSEDKSCRGELGEELGGQCAGDTPGFGDFSRA